jgi:hypothetical protein
MGVRAGHVVALISGQIQVDRFVSKLVFKTVAVGARRRSGLGAPAAAGLPVLGPLPALRSGSPCHRDSGRCGARLANGGANGRSGRAWMTVDQARVLGQVSSQPWTDVDVARLARNQQLADGFKKDNNAPEPSAGTPGRALSFS